MIALSNLAILVPRMFELLRKSQRNIHIITIETLVSMVSRYPQQFQQASNALFKEMTAFINDNDMQASVLALRLAIPSISIVSPTSAELQEFISKAAFLSKSSLIQGQTVLVKELVGFFQQCSSQGSVQDKTIAEIYSYVSLKSQAAGTVLAHIAISHKDPNKKTNLLNDFKQKLSQTGN